MGDQNTLQVALALVADKFTGGLKDAETSLASFIGVTRSQLDQLVVGIGAASAAILTITKSAANYGDELKKTSQKIGVSVEALAGLNYAAKIADLSNQELTTGLKKLSQAAIEADEGTGKGAAAFAQMGLSARGATGELRPTEDMLLDIAEKFKGTADDAAKTALAVALFGRAGIALIPFLNRGRDGLQELTAEAQKLGLVLTTEQAAASEKFNEGLKKIEASAKSAVVVVGQELVTAFNALGDALRKLAGSSSGDDTGLIKSFVFLLHSIPAEAAKAKVEIEMLIAAIASGELKTEAGRAAYMARVKAMQQTVDDSVTGKAAELAGIPMGGGTGTPGVKKPSIGGAPTTPDEDLSKYKMMGEAAKAYEDKFQADYTKFLTGIEEDDKAMAAIRMEGNQTYYEELTKSYEKFFTEEAAASKESFQIKSEAEKQYNDQYAADLKKSEEIADALSRADTEFAVEAMTAQMQASRTFFQSYLEGIEKFVNDTDSGFGLARQAAIQTAHEMSKGFQTFFFDVFTGQITSMKDVLKSVLTFAEQIIAKILADMATTGLLRGLGNIGLGNSGSLASDLTQNFGHVSGAQGPLLPFTTVAEGGLVRKFSAGGPVFSNGDSVPALLSPGEFVVSRSGVDALQRMNQGIGGAGGGNVTVNVHNAPASDQKPQVSVRRQMKDMVIDIVLSDISSNGPLRSAFRGA